MGVMVGEGAALEDTVVMPEAWIGPGSTLRRCIVGPGTEIPMHFEAFETLIVTDPDPYSALSPGVHRVAGLLVRRLVSAAA
jgi:ADP-glucose pyrophosphorylase